MPFESILEDRAQKDIRHLSANIKRQIDAKLKTLETNPQPDGKNIIKLKGYENLFRLRIGDYRAVFSIEGMAIRVLRIRHRKDIYGLL